jgi:hypothetical protein
MFRTSRKVPLASSVAVTMRSVDKEDCFIRIDDMKLAMHIA